ncbi:MAG: hypothetical protein Q7T63_04090 [Burkholderiaceae bacterium]|nr:hypothetical protein [Burkholderiaceae bacterium]MDP3135031.1 hypothetical protein [Burkholderiaceae bacterium]
MDFKENARAWLQANAGNHLPKGTRQYKFNCITTGEVVNMLGLSTDRQAVEGKVVHTEPGVFGIVKPSRTLFTVVDARLLPADLDVGSVVRVTPYQRRRFDGTSFLEPEKTETLANGIVGRTYVIGAQVSKIPVPAPTCEYLKAMLELLHHGKCSDGFRVISNMLVDFNARNISLYEPGANDRPLDPQFRFDCETGKFTGHVRIGLALGEDAYYVELFKIGEQGEYALANSCRNIMFDELAGVLETLLCDGQWKMCKVEVLKAAPRTRTTEAAAS